MKTRILAVCFAAASLLSVSPESAAIEGTFHDPAVGGEGWTFEDQNDKVFVTWFSYTGSAQSTFSTAVMDASYRVDATGNLSVALAGTLYHTQSRTSTVAVGPLSMRFDIVDGRPVGTVSGAGVSRRLVPFDYAFANELDRLHGTWVFAELAGDDSYAETFRLSATTTVVNGVTARAFTTWGGRPGLVAYNPETFLFEAILDNLDGSCYQAFFAASDGGAVGFSVLTNCGGVSLEPESLLLAYPVAGTDKKAVALDAALNALGVSKSTSKSVAMNDANDSPQRHALLADAILASRQTGLAGDLARKARAATPGG